VGARCGATRRPAVRAHQCPLPARRCLACRLALQGGDTPLAQALAGQDLIILATPVSAARSMLQSLQHASVPVAWLSKGFEAPVEAAASSPFTFGLMVHEIRAQAAINLRAGVLSGPSFALEVARGQPTALVAASEHAEVRDALVAAFTAPRCASTPMTTSWAWKWAAPSRTCWPSPPGFATACSWA
jgi:hypothetical protein